MIVDQIDRNEYRKFLKNTIIKGQKCQRNWDLNKSIPQEDIDLIIQAATECPSKQNLDFYSLLVIQNQEIQQKIYNTTLDRPGGRYNPQVLANLLLIFLPNTPSEPRNAEVLATWAGVNDEKTNKLVAIDRQQAVGVAAGFVNVISQSLGYSTGCNKCFNHEAVKEILGIKETPLLMMGVGHKNTDCSRRLDVHTGKEIDSYPKVPIMVNYVK
jgi:nitroreductase